jgi:MarR family transcriptional regulator, organic hydroperoxide resistance regulator
MDLVECAFVGPRATSAAREAWQCMADLLMSQEIQQRFLAACEAADLPPPQLKALLSFERGGAQSMRALAEGWHCDASWVTGIVDGLEERGYVQRQPHPTDRRVKVVVLTPLGDKAKARALERIYEPPAWFDALTPDEQVQLRDLLAKVRPARG